MCTEFYHSESVLPRLRWCGMEVDPSSTSLSTISRESLRVIVVSRPLLSANILKYACGAHPIKFKSLINR